MGTVWFREAFQLLQNLKKSEPSNDLSICDQQCTVLRSALEQLELFLKEVQQQLAAINNREASLVGAEVLGVLRRAAKVIESCEGENCLIESLLFEERREHFRDVHSHLYDSVELASTFLFHTSHDKSKVCKAYSKWLENKGYLQGAAAEDRRHLTILSLSIDGEVDSEETEALRLLSYIIVQKSAPMIDHDDVIFKQHLGHGGFGTVYEASFLDHLFAVKVFGSRDTSFDRELAALTSNKHPNILSVVGHSQDGSGRPSIVMEKMDMDLRDFLLKNRPSILGSIGILLQVATGMAWLHSRDVIHRDLKPQNVLISGKNELLVAKIADFGLARTEFRTFQGNSVTPQLGTRIFMAPEVWRSKHYSKRSDVFGYAMICYQVLTGREPYTKEEYECSDFMLRVSNGSRPSGLFPTACPPELTDLTKRCWSTDPNDRPHFSDICNQLRALKAKVITNISNFPEVRTRLISSSPTSVPNVPSSRSHSAPSRSGQSLKSRKANDTHSSSGSSSGGRSHKSQPQQTLLDPKKEGLFSLVQKGRMEEAFSKAITYNDPKTVWWVCSKLEPSLLLSFNKSMVLQIAEQINNDFGEGTVQRIAWLTTAVELIMSDYQAWGSPRNERFFQLLCQNLHGQLAVTTRNTELWELLASSLEGANMWLKRVQTAVSNANVLRSFGVRRY